MSSSSVRWVEQAELEELNPAFARGAAIGGAFCAEGGCLSPPRNVTACAAALAVTAVMVREHVSFTGLATSAGRVSGVQAGAGTISAPVIVLTGGPRLARAGRLAGIRIPAGGAAPGCGHPAAPRPGARTASMVFDLANGRHWRPAEGGLPFGMSNPGEPPGENRSVDEEYLARMRARLGALVPVTNGLGLRRIWAATIDYTPDHLPIIGRAPGLDHITVACAGGAGMMWGPGVARAAADVALSGATDVLDVSSLGLDRFDEAGRSRLASDPIALPFPERISSS